jgi:hypothetical protein
MAAAHLSILACRPSCVQICTCLQRQRSRKSILGWLYISAKNNIAFIFAVTTLTLIDCPFAVSCPFRCNLIMTAGSWQLAFGMNESRLLSCYRL